MESAKTSVVEHDTATLAWQCRAYTSAQPLCHCQSYSMTFVLETAIANQVQQEDNILPSDIALTGNKVSQDNFDVNEETPSGAGITHFTHGILIQELQDGYVPEQIISVNIPRTKDRSPKPIDHNITTLQPWFTKRQVEPVMPQKSCINEIDTTGIATRRMDESALESIDRQHPYSKLHLSEKSCGSCHASLIKITLFQTGVDGFKKWHRKDQLQEITYWLPCSNIISNN